MKVAVLSNWEPFASTLCGQFARELSWRIEQAGHRSTHVTVPVDTRTAATVEASIVSTLLLDIEVDLVIGLQFPAYLVPHPNKVIWMLEGAQDRPPHGVPPDSPDGCAWQHASTLGERAEIDCLFRSREILAPSRAQAARIWRTRACNADVLLPPLPAGAPGGRTPGGAIVVVGSCSTIDEQILSIEALAQSGLEQPLFIVDSQCGPEGARRIANHADVIGVKGQVSMITPPLEARRWRDLLERSCHVMFLGTTDGWYGFHILDAIRGRRTLITTPASRYMHELPTEGGPMIIVDPSVEALAKALHNADDSQLLPDVAGGQTDLQQASAEWDVVMRELFR